MPYRFCPVCKHPSPIKKSVCEKCSNVLIAKRAKPVLPKTRKHRKRAARALQSADERKSAREDSAKSMALKRASETELERSRRQEADRKHKASKRTRPDFN